MPIRITLSDREALEVDISLDEWNRAYQKAIRSDAMLEIEEPSGRILSINPHRVLFLETAPDPQGESADAGEAKARQVA
jgi:hypothetical protein